MTEEAHRRTSSACKKIVKHEPGPAATSSVGSSLNIRHLRRPRRNQGRNKKNEKRDSMLRIAENTDHPLPPVPGIQRLPHRMGAAATERILVVEDDRAVQKAL